MQGQQGLFSCSLAEKVILHLSGPAAGAGTHGGAAGEREVWGHGARGSPE